MSLLACACSSAPAPIPEKPTITVITFNTGTSGGAAVPGAPGTYGPVEAELADTYYGNGLAWLRAIEDTRVFFENVDADIVAFQEIFFSGECADIPPEASDGFVCETWKKGDPTVAQTVLDAGWQVACHLGKTDKCLAVNRRLGTLRGCAGDLCLDGLEGAVVPGCGGGGSRVGRGVIDLETGGTLTVVSVHGTSGVEQADQDCRVKQFEQVFVDLGDGEPAANGTNNLIMGDLNTDPARMLDFDESAQLFMSYVGDDKRFHFVSDVGQDVPPTYVLFNIDHVASDTLAGACVYPGLTEGHAPVTEFRYFDHKPVVCKIDTP